MLLRVTSWLAWGIVFLSFLAYMPMLKAVTEQSFDGPVLDPEYIVALEITFIIVALAEAGITILLRYYVLVKPLKRNSFSMESLKGKSRFFVIHIVDWLMASLIPSSAVVLTITTKRSDLAYGLFVVYFGLMLFLSPRLAPFEATESER